jgi:hypothetical protein
MLGVIESRSCFQEVTVDSALCTEHWHAFRMKNCSEELLGMNNVRASRTVTETGWCGIVVLRTVVPAVMVFIRRWRRVRGL